MKVTRFHKLREGEGVEIKLPGVINFSCCDCGLVHRIAFAVEENRKLGMVMKRMKRKTAERRRTFRPEDRDLCLYPHRRCKGR